MILLCHYIEYGGIDVELGRYLGGAGNSIFFLLSAMLYCFKYNGENVNPHATDCLLFAKKRIVKLGSSVWPFLVFVIVLYQIFGFTFSWFNIGLNFLFLSYLAKMPGISHLWFITVLMACYAEFMLLIRFKPRGGWFSWFFLILMVGIMALLEYERIPGLALGYMGFFGFVFMNGRELFEMAKNVKFWQVSLIILFNALCIVLFMNGLFEKSRFISFLLFNICGLSLLVFLLRYVPEICSRGVTFLSGISFEIYIVHFNLCSGPFVRITSWQYGHLLQFGLVVIISIVAAVILHYVAGKVEKPLEKLFKLNNKQIKICTK